MKGHFTRQNGKNQTLEEQKKKYIKNNANGNHI